MPLSLSRYEVLHAIGENHYARYFKGYDTVGERDVCIIEFLEKFRRNEDRWQQIWQQILGAGRIKHEYLVSVYDYDRDRGQVITELMQGSLRDLPPQSLTNTELVRTVLYRTLEALDYLHSNNHPHGDIRPANLLYDIAGQTKISYSPGISLGGLIPRREKDYAFLAPELFDPSFGEVGVGVDLYGCGMSALSLLLGQEFSQKLLGVATSDDVNWQRFHRDLNSHPSVRQLLPTLPPDMETVIQKLISKKVDQRFTSIVEARSLLIRPAVEIKIQVPDAKPSVELKRHSSASPVPFLVSSGGRPKSTPEMQKKPRPIRDWLNQKLKNPLVMGLVSAFIVSIMVFAMAVISVIKESSREVTVSLSSKPPGASMVIDEQPHEGVTDLLIKLPAGKHQLKLELSGYQSVTQNIEIPSDQEKFTIPQIVLNKVPDDPPKPVMDVPAKVEPAPVDTKWALPTGLVPMGSGVDESTGLPLKVSSTKLNSSLTGGDAPLSFVLIPSGEFSFGGTIATSTRRAGCPKREQLEAVLYLRARIDCCPAVWKAKSRWLGNASLRRVKKPSCSHGFLFGSRGLLSLARAGI